MENRLIRRIRFLFPIKKGEPYSSLKRVLGFHPIDISYYTLALAHKSAHLQKNGHTMNNERLEYLGDAVLGTVVADIVYNKFPNKSEGELTNIRSRIVQRSSLDALASEIGLSTLIKTDPRSTINFTKVHINGNAFEALMGAIYLDRGYSKCKSFILKLIKDGKINLEERARHDVNFKSKLIEWAQREKVTFEFRTDDSEFEREHNITTFHTSVYLQGIKVGEGKGTNKKESQQDASRRALKALKNKNLRAEIGQASTTSGQDNI